MYGVIGFQVENQGENSHSLDPRAPFNPRVIVCHFSFSWEGKVIGTVGTIWDLLKKAASNQPVIYCLRLFPSSTTAV